MGTNPKGVSKIKICLHNKKGQKQRPGDSIKLDGEGNCYECDYDPENNKNCKRFYPITIQTFEVKK